MLRFKNLASGSSGNATLVQATSLGHTTTILVDCGLSVRLIESRMLQAGVSIDALDAVFITHEHADHIGNALALALKHRIPTYMSQGTWHACGDADYEGLLHFAQDYQTISIGEIELRPFTVPHDAKEPLQLVCSNGDKRLGILTDLGHISSHVLESLQGCHALFLECNHDVNMLARSAYPPFLRQRVGGDYGHLSNAQAAAVLQELMHDQLRHVLAAHLSQQNNQASLVQAALAPVLNCAAEEVLYATQNEGSVWLEV